MYKGTFAGNGKTYEVIIGNTGTTTELTLAPDPVIIKYETADSEDPFCPLYLGSATINVIDAPSGLLHEIMSESPVLIRTGAGATILFAGYTVKDVISQSYLETSEFEINVIDQLSYHCQQSYDPSEKKIRYVADLLKTLGKVVYFQNIGIDPTELAIPDLAFFKEQDSEIKYKDVYEDILRSLGLTMMFHGNGVYIIDRAKPNISDFYVIPTTGDIRKQNLTLPQFDISDEIFELGSKIDLYPNYSRITATHEYNFPIKVVDFLDTKYLERRPTSEGGHVENITTQGKYKYSIESVFSSAINQYMYGAPNQGYPLEGFVGARILRYQEWDTDEIRTGRPYKSEYEYVFSSYRMNDLLGTPQPDTLKLLRFFIPDHAVYKQCGLGISFQTMLSDYVVPSKDKNTDVLRAFNLSSLATLRIGEYYWDGSEWTRSVSNFHITINEWDDEFRANRWYPNVNTNKYENYVPSLDGYVIPFKSSDFICGDLEFTLYIPTTLQPQAVIRTPYVLIKDLKISVEPISRDLVQNFTEEQDEIIKTAILKDPSFPDSLEIDIPITDSQYRWGGKNNVLDTKCFLNRDREEGINYRFLGNIMYDGKQFENLTEVLLYKYINYFGKPYLTTLNLGIIGQVYNPLYSFLDHNNYEDCFLSQSELSISLATGTSELKLNVHEPYRDIKYEIS